MTNFSPDAAPPPPTWLGWLDHNLIPFIQLLGKNPVIAGLVVALLAYALLYLPVALAVVWAFKVKFDNDRTKVSFRMLVVWNLLEFSALTPWVFSRKLAKHYWPLSYNPFDDKSGTGKIEPPKNSQKNGAGGEP